MTDGASRYGTLANQMAYINVTSAAAAAAAAGAVRAFNKMLPNLPGGQPLQPDGRWTMGLEQTVLDSRTVSRAPKLLSRPTAERDVYCTPEAFGMVAYDEINYSATAEYDLRVVWETLEGAFITSREASSTEPTPFRWLVPATLERYTRAQMANLLMTDSDAQDAARLVDPNLPDVGSKTVRLIEAMREQQMLVHSFRSVLSGQQYREAPAARLFVMAQARHAIEQEMTPARHSVQSEDEWTQDVEFDTWTHSRTVYSRAGAPTSGVPV